MIYLASPYSHTDAEVRKARFKAVSIVAARLMKMGFVVFSPIAHMHPIQVYGEMPQTDWSYWEKYDRWFIEKSERVVVCCFEGWGDSTGIKGECEIAWSKRIQVNYLRFSLPNNRLETLANKVRFGRMMCTDEVDGSDFDLEVSGGFTVT